ncbi:5' nucleotidase, NT5C type [Aneurinibacillus sp. Ricciae_BoGa-3]|uniref:5' nucleotidase, NT5C type n=1 Tax=Aneurinibacillus sp. Ricciae_BoGa-3 TaxID=3022697 RepID=UPI002FEE65A6
MWILHAPHNLKRFAQTGRLAVAMDYPYNRDVSCKRVSSWREFEDSLEYIVNYPQLTT